MTRLLPLVLALSFALPTSAQQQPAQLTDAARALLFQLSNFSGGGFNGSTLSYKRHTSPERALRLGLSVGGDVLFEFEDEPDRDRNQQSAFVSVTALPVRYRPARSSVALYTGIGPTAQLRLQRRASETSGTQTFTEVGLGATGVVGVEWFVGPAIGLLGEFGTTGVVIGGLGTAERLGVRVSSVAQVGASVYF